jgi:sugar/nucleoside kinase (ribokinase family)
MKPEKRWEVITVGDVFIDLVLSGFARWPQPGEEVEATSLQYEAGGGAGITACGLSKLGTGTAIVAAVGKADSAWLRARLVDYGVTVDDLRIHPSEPTAVTVSVSTPQDRAFFTYPGANRWLGAMLKEQSTRRLLQQARHVHLATTPAANTFAELIAELHHAGCTVSLDAGWQPDWLSDAEVRRALQSIDLFMPNEREAALMTRETEPEAMLQAFAKAGLRGVALKLGERGSMLYLEGCLYTCPPLPVQPLDTTGAGDCFDAGFIHAWLKGEPPLRCLQYGNICGALSTLRLGGLEGFPTAEELQTLLSHQYSER